MTLEELAASAGISVSYLSRLETGERNLSLKTMGKVATALGLRDAGRIVRIPDGDEPAKVIPTPPTRGEKVVLAPYEGPPLGKGVPTVPVYAATQGGKGHMIITIDPIEHASAPDMLVGVRDAYGIQVVGESMVPAYEPGDIVWVHPHKTPQRGKDCVLYHGKPTGEAESMIKRLVSWTDREWKLRQWNPAEDFTESRKDWPVCHVIVGKRNA